MWQCECCNTIFDEPRKEKWSEAMPDSCSEWFYDELCPVCGESHFYRVVECPGCGEFMEHGRILCKSCAQNLLDRFNAFCDELTADEEDQLDAWLDGVSIKDRKELIKCH